MSSSLKAYVPAMVFQKAISMARVLLFAHLITSEQYDLWGLGLMLLNILPLGLTLGTNYALGRFVSGFEARGQLREFYRRIRWPILGCCLLLTAVAASAAKPISSLVFHGDSPEHLRLYAWSLANCLAMALYFNLVAFMSGLRTYRLVAGMELFFNSLFAVLGAVALVYRPTGQALMAAHVASLAVSIPLGLVLLHAAIRKISAEAPAWTGAVPQGDGPPLRGIFGKALSFGVPAMIGAVLWVCTGLLSFYLTSRQSRIDGGVYMIFVQIAQPVAFLASTAWTVVYGHVARRWESGEKEQALENLQTAFVAVAAVTMTAAVLLYAAAPGWVFALPPAYRGGVELLGGLLMLFQATAVMGLLNMLCFLRHQPAAGFAAAGAGIAVNALLAAWWLPLYGAAGAAWAAGAGVFVGAAAVMTVYLFLARVRLQSGAYLMLSSPALLALGAALPAWTVAVAWALVLAVALKTRLLLDVRQREILGRFWPSRGAA